MNLFLTAAAGCRFVSTKLTSTIFSLSGSSESSMFSSRFAGHCSENDDVGGNLIKNMLIQSATAQYFSRTGRWCCRKSFSFKNIIVYIYHHLCASGEILLIPNGRWIGGSFQNMVRQINQLDLQWNVADAESEVEYFYFEKNVIEVKVFKQILKIIYSQWIMKRKKFGHGYYFPI